MSKDDIPSGSEITKPKRFKILKTIFGKKNSENPSLSDTLVELASTNEDKDTDIGAEEKEILINAINFTDIIAEEVMVPRSDIISAPIDASFSDLQKLFLKHGHARILIYEENLDNVKGFIHIKDLIKFMDNREDFKIEDVLRKIIFVPPSMKIVDLMLKMRDTKIRVAIAIDEYGGTDGLITMEDLIEEIVGEVDENEIIKISKNKYEVSARIKIDLLETKLATKFASPKYIKENDFDTLGGLIVTKCKRIPKTGEVIKLKPNINIIIKEAEARYIKQVIIQIIK